mmetsp:Transcript_18517/g.26107  ORF Transcript_18517/g.26107 Transcript_18517/m.26107 type:complete len:209 (-) Transcript_18517:63-689(-)
MLKIILIVLSLKGFFCFRSTEFRFSTQTEIVLCSGLGVEFDLTEPEIIAAGVRNALDLTSDIPVTVSTEIDKCQDQKSSWQARISIWNDDSNTKGASEIASEQIDKVYTLQNEFLQSFLNGISDTLHIPADIEVETIGYIVVWLDGSGANKVSDTSDTVTFLGTIIYWPFWLWILYTFVVVFFIMPFTIIVFRDIRDKQRVAVLIEDN